MARTATLHTRRLPIAALIVAALGGCTRYEPRPLDPAAHSREFLARLPDDSGVLALADQLRAKDEPIPAFDATDGLSLVEAEVVALFFNTDLRAARLRAGVARASAENAGLWQDPMVKFDGERIIESVDYPWIIGGMVGLTLPISGSLEAEKHLAQGEHAAALSRVFADEWRTRIELRRAWLEWSAASERLTAAETFTGHLHSLIEIVRRLEEAGELARIESRLFYLEESRRHVELRDLRAEVEQRTIAIHRIMGLAPHAPVSLLPAALSVKPPVVESDEGDLLRLGEGNPSLQSARADYESSERALQLEIRRQYPDIEIGLGGGSEDDEPRILFGLSIPLPILNRNQRAIAEATALRDVSRAAFESLVEQLSYDLASARTRRTAAAIRRESIERNIAPLADQQEADARRSAELGEFDTLLILESVTRQYEAKRDLIDAALDESLASITILELLGPPASASQGALSP